MPAGKGRACSVKVEELLIKRGKQEIYCVLRYPEGKLEKKLPTVVFAHGYFATHAVWDFYASSIVAQDFAAFSFDFCGGSPDSRSTGTTLEMTVFSEVEDLTAVISEIESLSFIDSGNVFLVGGSLGGVVSAIVAARNPKKIRGMALIYPAFMLCDNARALFKSVEEIPTTYSFLGMTVSKHYFESLFNFDVYQEILPYKGNVLIIHGDADKRVPLCYSLRAKEEYASAQLKIIPGAGHGFSEIEARQAVDWIYEYLQKEITPQDY